ncbi:MAG: DUF4011 domain-containing protein [Bacilli bacterium]|nr:DUF4011 domain-containing protein [Bacilli bacterium]
MSIELENLGVSLDISASKSVNYVNYQAESLLKEAFGGKQNSFSFLRNVSITNKTDKDIRDVIVKYSSSPEFFEISSTHITCLEKNKTTIVDSFQVILDVERLYGLNEALPGSLTATVYSSEGEVLAVSTVNLSFLPIEESASSEWIEEILASFVTPNDPYVKELVEKAAKIKSEKYGSSAFDEYQTRDPNGVIEDLDALYLAFQSANIRYSTTPASFRKIFQRVRLPHEVATKRVGNCLDMSLLFASMIESVGLRPILICAESHALVGVWLEEMSFANSKEENMQTLINNAAEGFNHLVLVNIVTGAEGNQINFADSVKGAKEFLEKASHFYFALDIKKCRQEWILPVPTAKINEDGEVSFDFPTIESSRYVVPTVDLSSRRFLPEDHKGEKNRYDYWQDKLLDLNLRNRLVNYKGGLRGIEFETVNPTDLISFLSKKEKVNVIPTKLKLSDEAKKDVLSFDEKIHGPSIKEGYSKDSLIAVTRNDDVEESLKLLARKSNTAIEESGCNPLFMTLGEIRWFDNEKAAERGTGAMYAPIFLLKVKMPRRKSGLFYTIEYDFDEIGLNNTFFQYLKQNYSLDFSRLYPLPRLNNGQIDIRLIYNEIRNIIAPMKNWLLFENRSVLSLFNFSHFVMWSDLRNHRNTVMNNKLVASFVYGEKKWNDKENLIDPLEMDNHIKPKDLAIALPADSSQIKAIVDAEKGESFILDGPPGTGKSQTIANMITNFLYHGKKVLFVAEKEVALDVVKKRLDDLHLGQFCLEIASLSKNKSDILSGYTELLNMGPLENSENYAELGKSILDKRAELNSIMNSLHENGSYFVSPYDAIVGYLELEKYHTKSEITKKFIDSLSVQKYIQELQAIQAYVDYSASFGSFVRSPFIAFQKRDYNLVYREKIFEELESFLPLIKECELASYNAFHKQGLLFETYNNVKHYVKIIEDLRAGVPCWSDFFLDSEFVSHEEELRSLSLLKTKLAKERDEVLAAFSTDVLTRLDPISLSNEYDEIMKLPFFKKLFAFSKFKKKFKPFTKNKDLVKNDGVKKYIDILKEIKFDQEKIKGCDDYSRYILGTYDFSTLAESDSRLSEFETTIDIAKNMQQMEFVSGNGEAFAEYIKAVGRGAIFSEFNNKLKSFVELFEKKVEDLKYQYEFDVALYGDTHDYFKYLHGKVSDAIGSAGRLSEWCNLLSYHDRMKKYLPKDFYANYMDGKISEADLINSFKADLYYAFLGYVLPEKGLSSLSKASTEELSKNYVSEVSRLQELAVNVVAAKITEKYPSNASSFASSTSAYKLTKLAKNGGRGASLRYIFDEFKDLILTLTPCFMMSPVAVAQYLSMDKYHFDVVIFDEASQIPTSEAVGAMARADSVIIAGDEQQMPPTNFFTSSLTLGGEELTSLSSVDEDLDSLLDDAISLSFPRERLEWHYRSRHESLIAFSNNRFYDNSLLTFPSPKEELESVSFKYVKGEYERGRGINKPEAVEVVKEVIKRLKNKELREHSIGVVTFNEAQQNIIEDMLEKELAKNPNLESMPGGEKIFVKNLENVQGDERDVVLFSVTYGPDKEKRISLNFGPLSQKKGERRLNVAVSRAREEMIVYSSIKPEEIMAERAKNMGASYLRDFLLFAQKGVDTLANRNLNEMGDEPLSIASFIKNDLEQIGFVVKENLGSSTFKIDLAIASKESPNDYVLGVIIDNKKNCSLTCRDRHINEPSVLSRLGWNIHRLYSVEYLDHKEEVIKSIVNSYNRSLAGEKFEEEKANPNNPLFVKKVVISNPNKRPYNKAKYDPRFGKDFFVESDIIGFFIETIGTEYPISSDLLEARFRESFGISRIGSNVRSKYLLALNNFGNVVTETCGGRSFLYPRGMTPNAHRYWRSTEEGDVRKIMDISFIEIGNCAADIVSEQGQMSLEDLCHEVNIALGYSVLKKTSHDYIKSAIMWNCSRRNGLFLDKGETVGIR